jgi:hypothetical protein
MRSHHTTTFNRIRRIANTTFQSDDTNCSIRPELAASLSESAPRLDSRIISDIPEIFAEFRGKRFEILWRGSRSRDFHHRCDGKKQNLIVIFGYEREDFRGVYAAGVVIPALSERWSGFTVRSVFFSR